MDEYKGIAASNFWTLDLSDQNKAAEYMEE